MKFKKIDDKRRLINSIKKVNGCWEWQKSLNSGGYGRIMTGSRVDNTRKIISVHRYSYSLFVSEIPKNKWVLHTCDNRKCLNPKHLFLGDRQDNVDDRENKMRNKLPNVKNENHPSVKLKWKIVNDIRLRYSKGERISSIAKDYIGMTTRRNISDIVNYKTWLPEPPK